MTTDIMDDDVMIIGGDGLLVEQGKKTKIALEGFNEAEHARLTQLITRHGGVLDSSTGIILSETPCNRRKSTMVFHIDWLHDSIQYNRIQDLQSYCLPPNKLVLPIKEENADESAENMSDANGE